MNIVISTRTILITILILIGGWLLLQIQTIALALFVSLILAMALDPLVDKLTHRRFPRILAVLFVFLAFVVFVIFAGTALLTPLVTQTERLIQSLPMLLDTISGQYYGQKLSEALFSQATQTTGNVVKITIDVFSNLLLILTVLVFTFYLLLDFDNLAKNFVLIFPKEIQEKMRKTISEIEIKLGSWLRGQVSLMLIVGIAEYLGLTLLNIDYALPLGLLAGILEIVPMVGPILAMIPALIVGFATSPIAGLGVLALYLFVQQLENNFIVPKVMSKAVGFNPLIVMLVLLIGGKLLGVLGAILAVPITLMGYIIFKNIYSSSSAQS